MLYAFPPSTDYSGYSLGTYTRQQQTDCWGRLAAVNCLLAGVGITQVTRILMYQSSQKTGSVEKAVEKDAKDVADTAKGVAKDPQRAARKVEVEIK